MSAVQPVAVYALRVPPGGALIPAVPNAAAMFRVSMAAIDPDEAPDFEDDTSSRPRATLKIVRAPPGLDLDDEDEDDDDYEDVGDEDSEDDEEINGGPSDKEKARKLRAAAALKEAMEEDDESDDGEEFDLKAAISKLVKGKAPATDDDDEDEDDDESLELDETVICTLDPERNYQQPLDITVAEGERVFFKVTGTHTIFLTGNYVMPLDEEGRPSFDEDEDEDEGDYDLSPDEDEIDLDELMLGDDESDDLDDLEDPRITEVDSEEEEAPKLVETKSKKKRAADEEGLEDIMAKANAATNGESKKQQKKLKKNNGEAAAVAAKQEPKEAKKVQFAKNLEQGPTPSKDQKPPEKTDKTTGTLGVKEVKGVTIDDKKLGKGAAAVAGKTVAMRYIGKLENGKVFDANKKGKPFTFKLGKGEVIKGWDIGVAGMAVGGERRITIPPHLAYGKKALPGIPANSKLVFDIRLRIHQRSSRLLSLLGLRSSTPGKSSCSVSAVKVPNPPDTASDSQSEAETALHQNVPDRRKPHRRVTSDCHAKPAAGGLKRSQSTPVELTRIVPLKLSSTFGNPTVIRRSHLNRRPSAQALHFQTAPIPPPNAQPGESSGSSVHSSKGSPIESLSTAPTSVFPGSVGQSKDVSCGQPSHCGHHASHAHDVETPLSPVRELRVISPSILTAEAAANAKVFFETYFNTLYAGMDTRTQRQYELDQYIAFLPLSPEERMKVKSQWIAQEREYLRQCRVLKSRSHSASSRNETPSLAGFEVIKILGRGSFGVVRLVKEKGSDSPTSVRQSEEVADRQRLANHRQAMVGVKKDVFAMKVIRKSVMIRNSQEGHLRAERDFLVASANSRWIVPLIANFQDDSHLYLVMDYMVGGDFLGLLMRHNILAEDIARWYVAEMILCIEEAHRLHWIHRDVKPDNFLISASGHLKISDFGLAFDGHWAHDQWYFTYQRHSLLRRLGIQVDGDAEDQREMREATKSSPNLRREDGSLEDDWIHPPTNGLLSWRDRNQKRRMARSVVGTSQYMAPEVIRGHPYDGRCDWWSIGIILYECLYGSTPFASEDRHKTKMKIHHHLQTLYFPVHRPANKLVSAEAIDFINSLLQEKEFRLSSNKYKVNDVLNPRPSKRFFSKVDPANQNYQGLYVYPNDATDIKSHPFFRGINWDGIHRTVPPFIPKVKGWEDTRYFEDGDYPSDHYDETTDSDVDQAKEDNEPHCVKDIPQANGRLRVNGKNQNPQLPMRDGHQDSGNPPAKKKKPKEPRRPRDKILRDKRLRKTVLDMRKKGAFLGYTYRRPKGVIMALTPDRGRPFISQGHLSELYG
ncbi:uncharacterized protein BJX67DRAFT_369859 [Aspergillus lucknowensis]|uniref:peptidylprolyl isomerase n=1 Tax=Aspergillus lucknowensis TaxID=176173 RepID=A0ABR4M2B3_9EURO